LDNLIFKGSGKPDTIKLIREKLNSWLKVNPITANKFLTQVQKI
jgi:hypothetical protein